MANERSTVILWVGRFPSRERFDAYFAEHLSEDGRDEPLNAFAADLEIGFYDHDFVERSFRPEAKGGVEALLRGHSYAEAFSPQAVARWEEVRSARRDDDAPPLNVAVLAFGDQISSTVSCRGEDYELHHVGQFACAPSDPSPASEIAPAHAGRVTLARSLGGSLVLTGARYGEVGFWDLASGTRLAIDLDTSRRDWVHAVAHDAPGARLLTCSDELVLWEPRSTPPRARVLGGHEGAQILDLALGPTGDLALTASVDRGVGLWGLALGARRGTFTGHGARVVKVCFLDADTVSSVDDTGTVLVWRWASLEILHRIAVGSSPAVARWLPDRRVLVLGLRDGRLVGWQPGRPTLEFEREAHPKGVADLRVLACGTQGVSVGDAILQRWDLETGALLATYAGHGERVQALALGAPGVAFSGSRDGSVRAWDLAGGREIARLELAPAERAPVSPWLPDPYEIGALATDSSGTRLLAGDGAGRVHLLRYESESLSALPLASG